MGISIGILKFRRVHITLWFTNILEFHVVGDMKGSMERLGQRALLVNKLKNLKKKLVYML